MTSAARLAGFWLGAFVAGAIWLVASALRLSSGGATPETLRVVLVTALFNLGVGSIGSIVGGRRSPRVLGLALGLAVGAAVGLGAGGASLIRVPGDGDPAELAGPPLFEPGGTPRDAGETLMLDRQTREVAARCGSAYHTDVPSGSARLLVGYAALDSSTEPLWLVVRVTDGAAPRTLLERPLHEAGRQPAWIDVAIELPTGASAVEIAIDDRGGGCDARRSVASRPAFVRPRDHSPRNLVLISIDTLRADRLGAYGYTAQPTSPHFDALATRGTLFERVVAPSPWTIPSHMAMLTGIHPEALGMARAIGKTPRLSPRRTTLAERFRDDGFVTVAFTATGPMRAKNGFADGFFLYQEAYNRGDLIRRDLDTNSYLATRWLREHGAEPFFLFLHTYEVHAPYGHSRYVDARIPPDGVEERHATYASGIAFTDRHLDLFLQDLEQLGLTEETLIVVTSDHGEAFREHGEYELHGDTLYDELLHVPLLLVGPGIPAGRRVVQQVPLLDLYATLADYFGLDELEPVDSRSLRPLVEGTETAERAAFLCCLSHAGQKLGLRADGYKYVMTFLPGGPGYTEELFDLRTDPGEEHDVAFVFGERVQAMRRRVLDMRRRNRKMRREAPPAEITREYETQLRALGYVE